MLRLETVVPQPWFQDTDRSTGFAGPDLIVRRFLPPFSTKIKAVIGRYPLRALAGSSALTFAVRTFWRPISSPQQAAPR